MSSAVTSSKERTLEVNIERLLPGGVGLAHAEGLTVLVSLAAPGDRVRVHINHVRGKVAFASIREIVKPSPVRVEPPCPYFGRCGGCDFQQLDYQAQLQAKVEIIRDCLYRIAHIEKLPEIAIVPSSRDWRYRSRATWQFDPRTRNLGYFERGSHRVCDVEYCAVLVPELQRTLEEFRNKVREHSLFKGEVQIEVAAGDEGVSVAPINEVLEVSRAIGAETYYFNALSFFQINHELTGELVATVTRGLRGDLAIDLYSGVGLFTLPLSRSFARVIAIDSNSTATRFARRSLRAAGLQNTRVLTARVGDWLDHNCSTLNSVDVLLLDPPRSGVEAGVLEKIIEMRPLRISYISCDPATLARDLRKLLTAGYSLDSIDAFDMFPQTHHVETVAVLVSDHNRTRRAII